jgi:hypothetical protein
MLGFRTIGKPLAGGGNSLMTAVSGQYGGSGYCREAPTRQPKRCHAGAREAVSKASGSHRPQPAHLVQGAKDGRVGGMDGF